jgi:diamine N-acetyltransferase
MIKGNVIGLRALEPDDADMLFGWENDEKLWHVSNTLAPYSRFAIEQYVLNCSADIYASRELRLMITTLDGNISVGAVDLFEFDPLHLRAGIGIMVHEQYRTMGYAKEALSLMIGFCFRHLGLHQIYCNISAGNETSIHLFRTHGFELAGRKKDWVRYNGKWQDELILQLFNTSLV